MGYMTAATGGRHFIWLKKQTYGDLNSAPRNILFPADIGCSV
jgi:hypothetical protein